GQAPPAGGERDGQAVPAHPAHPAAHRGGGQRADRRGGEHQAGGPGRVQVRGDEREQRVGIREDHRGQVGDVGPEQVLAADRVAQPGRYLAQGRPGFGAVVGPSSGGQRGRQGREQGEGGGRRRG